VNHEERLEGYCFQMASQAMQPVYAVSDDSALLTPAQKRRLDAKRQGRKTHSHAGLPPRPDDPWGRRMPCPRCQPQSAAPQYVGGVPWRT
jgi:hypothetical protein